MMFANKSSVNLFLRPLECILNKLPRHREAMEECDECNMMVFKFQLEDHRNGHFALNRN